MCANFDMVVCSLGKCFHHSKVPTKKTSQTESVEGDIITLSERLLIALFGFSIFYSPTSTEPVNSMSIQV